MIINENLVNIEDIVLKPINRSYNFEPIFLNKFGLINGEIYTISLDCIQTEKGSGRFTFDLYDYNLNDLINQVGVFGKRNYMTFKYIEGQTYKINLYTDIDGKCTNIGAKFYNIKLEEGDQMTLHLPHKSKVKPENQAIFPIGGVRSKRFIQTKKYPKQSSYRKEVVA